MLCLFAHTFPNYVSFFLDQSKGMSRRFREESVTDLMMASLATISPGSIIVDYPNERITGADMEWNFVNRDEGSFFRILVQAKRLYGSGENWKTRSYSHLFYKSKSARDPQAVVLSNTAISEPNTYPLFAFYNPGEVCRISPANLHGVTLADGHIIAELVQTTRGKTEKRTKSLGFLWPLMFSLPSLLCPENIVPMEPQAFSRADRTTYLALQGRRKLGTPLPPAPQTVWARIKRLRETFSSSLKLKLPELSSIGNEIPVEIERLIERHTIHDLDMPKRLRVVFMSRSERQWTDFRPMLRED